MTALTQKMIVISLDCLSALDYPLIKTLPNFQRIFKKGSFVRNVETIYPSLTYPCHCTIVTGKYPKNHGVVNNTLLQPGVSSPDWNWYRKAIRGTTLYDEASKIGLTTAALLWPVTGRAKNIQYNLPEIFPNRPWQNQIMVSLLNGTPTYQWELNRFFSHVRNGLNQPELDDFVLESTIYTIKKKEPNLMLIHFVDLDSMRHQHGVFSKQATEAIIRHDKRLGRILDVLEEKGTLEETTIIVLGDHGALDEQKAISLNVLFHEQQLIDCNNQGKIIDWKAYCKSCDGSAYIYLKDPDDLVTKERVSRLLNQLMVDGEKGIEQVLSSEEAVEMGADPSCAFMIEAKYGYYFIEDYLGEYMQEITSENRSFHSKFTLACHGYSPKKADYTTFFLASGKGIHENVEVPYMHLVDIGPTLARLLGLNLGEVDGRIMDELITT